MLSKQNIKLIIGFILIILVGVIILPETEGFKKKKKYKDPVGHKINRWFRNLVKPDVIKKTTTTTTTLYDIGSIYCPVVNNGKCALSCPEGKSADDYNICQVNAVTPPPASAPALAPA
jgi:hypothetical protein